MLSVDLKLESDRKINIVSKFWDIYLGKWNNGLIY